MTVMVQECRESPVPYLKWQTAPTRRRARARAAGYSCLHLSDRDRPAIGTVRASMSCCSWRRRTWQAASHRRLLFVFRPACSHRSRFDSVAGHRATSDEAERDHPIANAVIAAAALLIAFLALPWRARTLMAQVEQQSPVKAVDFIEGHLRFRDRWCLTVNGPTGVISRVGCARKYPDFIDEPRRSFR